MPARSSTSIRFTWYVFASLCLASLAGCRRTYDITATYQALDGGYQAVVTAKGSFSTDYDLNPVPTGKATITPLNNQTQPTITLEMPGNNTVRYRIGNGPESTLPWMSLDSVPSLHKILEEAGYPDLADGEVEEMAWCIEGVTYGPKGTHQVGQGKFINAVSVISR